MGDLNSIAIVLVVILILDDDRVVCLLTPLHAYDGRLLSRRTQGRLVLERIGYLR